MSDIMIDLYFFIADGVARILIPLNCVSIFGFDGGRQTFHGSEQRLWFWPLCFDPQLFPGTGTHCPGTITCIADTHRGPFPACQLDGAGPFLAMEESPVVFHGVSIVFVSRQLCCFCYMPLFDGLNVYIHMYDIEYI